jgi:hypothetical protein
MSVVIHDKRFMEFNKHGDLRLKETYGTEETSMGQGFHRM